MLHEGLMDGSVSRSLDLMLKQGMGTLWGESEDMKMNGESLSSVLS